MKRSLITYSLAGFIAIFGPLYLFVAPMFAKENQLPTSTVLPAASSSVSVPVALPAPLFIPSWIPVASSSQVTITIPISESFVIPTSVNLIRLQSNGSTSIIGLLNDSGIDGDIAASDGVYSIQIPLTATSAGPIKLEISAAFKGILKRAVSPAFSIIVATTPPPLPPDPGVTGMQTLNGIDSDGDGVRDDVQRYIATTYTDSARTQSAVTQLAKAQLAMIANATDTTIGDEFALEQSYALECLSATTSTNPNTILTSLENQIQNTPARMAAYVQAEALAEQTFTYRLSSNPQTRCLVPLTNFSN